MSLSVTTTDEAAAGKTSILVWGKSGVGKTSLAKTIPVSSDDKLCYIAVDQGYLALRDRQFVCVKPTRLVSTDDPNKDEVIKRIKLGDSCMRELAKFLSEKQESDNPFEAIVIDGLDDLGKFVQLDLEAAWGDNGFKLWGEFDRIMFGFLQFIQNLPGTTVVITHDEETGEEHDRSWQPRFVGKKATKALPDRFDIVLAYRVVQDLSAEGRGTRRVLQTSRMYDKRYVSKDRSGVLEEVEAPDLGKVLAKIHKNQKGGK